MSEILSADELEPARQFVGFVKRNGGTRGAQRNSAADLIERLLVSHEALSRRLAEVKAERDRALRRAQAERTANEAIRVLEEERDGAIAGQVMLDDKLTLMEHRALAAERRLAEVERIADEMGDGVSPECSGFADKIRAVLDKGEPDE